ncbi:discoidin domain-containing protein [Nonomuraea sp. NPDC050556]|uniref:discoidin domain-containing protein n=1 Tax=Nonomuraea sp. NPDC050556 TaxID=3364369 RepID=UPI003798561A
MRKPLRLAAAVLAAVLLIPGWAAPATAAGGPNLSPGKATQASSSLPDYPVSNVNDGNQATYWESANNAFPQWARIDLGAPTSVDQIVLKVPAPAAWQTRTQTLTVQGGADGTTFSTVKASAGYTFNPATGNAVTIDFPAATHRYWRVLITANTGWPAAQISEFEIYGAATGGDTQKPTAPGNLTYTQPAAGQIRLAWSASTDNVDGDIVRQPGTQFTIN